MINTEHIIPIAMTATEQAEIYIELNSRDPKAKLTEWGSGGSTILWYVNLTDNQQLVSIENDPAWAERVRSTIDKLDIERDFKYYVYETAQDGATFTPEHEYYSDYVQGPDHIWDSDVYLVDGRVRVWCARTIFERAQNRSAVVYCHDYAHNGASYRSLLDLYPRHEIIATPDTEYQMLKLWLE